jgi:hypothetical protein
LRDNLAKAKNNLKMSSHVASFRALVWTLSFYEDSFNCEAPYLGMEHQSSVTYGNGFKNGYRGRDLSATGWGLSLILLLFMSLDTNGFANNITYKDMRICGFMRVYKLF